MRHGLTQTIIKGLIIVITAFASLAAQAQDPQKAMRTNYGMGYTEYLPADYGSSTTSYPAIIFLHGSGERGNGTPAELEKVKVHGPPKHIKNGHKMCFTSNGKTECFIVLSPQTIKWGWRGDVVPFVKYALETYRIDPDRVYVTGLSMGGEGTWYTGSGADNTPNYFAAIAPVAARAAVTDGTSVAAKSIAVWAFHGDADAAMVLAAGQRPITAMINAGANPAPLFTVYPGVSHSGTWDRAYNTGHTHHSVNLYEWFLTQRRPSSVIAPPMVNAGADKTLVLPTSSTSFTAVANGEVTSYNWAKLSGPSINLANTTTPTLSVDNASVGTYVFAVTVRNSANMTSTDQVHLTVNSTNVNQPPTVEAGVKQSINLPANSATFNAIASDSDGTISSYRWTKIGGGTIVMNGTTTSSLSLSGAVKGTYVFKIQVTDNSGATAADTVRLAVNASTSTQQLSATTTEFMDLSLGQNYPNPFSTFTKIPFALSHAGPVTLKVYNAEGQELTTLINNILEAGEHTVTLNASALSTSGALTTELYYYKLISNTTTLTKRFMLSK